MSTFRLPVEQVGLEQSIQRAMRKFQTNPLRINVDDKSFTQPLGRITASADEFTKSIEASNARVVAFGASVAVINAIQNSFKQLVVQTVQVEKSLADINVVLGASSANLEKFGNNLFRISKNTAQSFDEVATAATEFARQGLSVEKTLKRTNDALVLTRLTGMKATDAVKGLTAAVNSFSDAGVNTTEVMNKLAAVDMAFAVSSEDLINGLSRAAAVAQDAGMNIDQLIGSITAAQQITARGGAVIGNSFKTIFTRIQRPETINQLEQLGVAVKDVQGNVLPAIKILESLAKTYDGLTQSQQSNTAQLVGGMFQINILKAAMRDLGKENSITAQAIKISSQATDEAAKKNEQLNKTMAALTNKTMTSLQQLAAQIGEITVGPGIEKILKAVNGLSEGITNVLDGEGIASNFANGFLKGLGNIVTGPGAVLILGLVGKLFIDVGKFAKTSLGNFMGMTTEAQKQRQVQESILNLLRTNADVSGQLIGQGQTKTQQEQILLDLIVKQTAAHREQLRVAQELSKVAVRAGANQELVIPRGRRAAGHIPNFAKNERQGALEGGYAPGAIKSMNMPGEGMVIYNSAERVKKMKGFQQPFINPPMSSNAGKEHRQKSMDMYGIDPYASTGHIPNFAGASSYMKMKGSTLKGLEQGVASGKISGAGAHNLSPDIFAAVTRGTNAKKAAASNIRDKKLAAEQASRIQIDAGSTKFGGPFAALIPNRNANFDQAFQSVNGTIKKGKNSYPFTMQNLAVRGPTIPVPEGKVTEPDEGKIEKNISQSIFDNSAKYANTILPVGKGDVTSQELKSKLLSAGGGKGAVAAAVGAGFEAAVAAAYGIDSSMASRTEGGDFDIKDNLKTGSLKKVNDLFGLSGYSVMDFKASASSSNLSSMAKKIFNQNPTEFLKQIKKGKAGKKAASRGFIPNFAESPLMDAVKRERDAGIPVSAIRVNQSDKLVNSSNPTGLAVTNTIDEPRGLKDVPNFAARPAADFVQGKGLGSGAANPAEWAKSARFVSEDMKKFVRRYQLHAKQRAGLTKEQFQKELAKNKLTQNANKHETREALKQLGFSKSETKEALKQVAAARKESGNAMRGPGNVATAGMDNFRQRAGAGRGGFAGGVGRMGRGMSGMGFMMGAPMAGAVIDSAFKSDKSRVNMSGGERFSQNVGSNVLTGAATGAMMGGMIGSVVPVVGNAVGAAVGGTIGAIGGLAKSISEMEVSTAELAEATSEAAAAHQANTASFNAIVTGIKSGKSDSETKDMISREAAKVDGIKVGGKTFTQAIAGSDGSDFAMQEIISKFSNQSKKGIDKASLTEGVSKFKDRIDNALYAGLVDDQERLRNVRKDTKDSDYSQEDVDAMSKVLGQNVSLDSRQKIVDKMKSGEYDDFEGFAGLNPLGNEGFNIGADIAGMMGFEEGTAGHTNMADALEDLIDEGGIEELQGAIQQSIDAVEEERKEIEAGIQVRKNYASKQADATKAMERSLMQDNLAVMSTNNARATNIKVQEFLGKYTTLNKSIDERIAIEKGIAENEVLINATTEKEARVREIREKLLRDGLNKMKQQGVTGNITVNGETIDKIDHARNQILNASESELLEMVENGEVLKKITQTDKEVFRKGGDISNFLDGIALEYEKQDGIASKKTDLDLQNIDLQARINAIQQKEAKAREDFAQDLKSRSQDLSIAKRQIDDQLKRTLGQIDRDYNLPFEGRMKTGTADPVALRKVQEEKQMKRAAAEFEAAQRKIQIDIEKSFTDAFSNAKNINALDSNTEAIKKLTSELMADKQEAIAKPLIEGLERLAKQSGADINSEQSIPSQIKSIREAKEAELKSVENQDVDRAAFDKGLQAMTDIISAANGMQLEIQRRDGLFTIVDSTDGSVKWQGNRKEVADQQNQFSQAMNVPQNQGKPLQHGQRLNFLMPPQKFTTGMDQIDPDQAAALNAYDQLHAEKRAKTSALSREIGDLGRMEFEAKQDTELLKTYGVNHKGKFVPAEEKPAPVGGGNFDFSNTLKLVKGIGAEDSSKILSNLNSPKSNGNLFTDQDQEGLSEETKNKIAAYNTLLTDANLEAAQRKDLEVQMTGVIKNSLQSVTESQTTYDEAVKNAKKATQLSEIENDLRNQLNDEMKLAVEEAKNLNERGYSGRAAQTMFEAKVARGKADPMYAGPSNVEGFTAGYKSMLDDIPTESEFFNQLGNTLPRTFADNMATALTEGLAGIKSWDDALHEVAMGFLNTLQQALNQRIADQMLGFMNQGLNSMFGGFSKGGVVRRNSGGLVEGGSGTKDDVPAMLNSGEYVIRKAAVNKYGTEFLSSLNQGTTQRRNEGGIMDSQSGQDHPERPEQSGEGGYLLPSSGEAGAFIAGEIKGRENLLTFAKQGATSGANDIISSAGAIDEFGQTMYQGQGLNMQLEDESMRLSGVGLRQSPVADEVLQAKRQALDAVSAYDGNVKAQEDYRTARRKAIQGAIKGALISAAVSAGMSQLSGAMQASGTAKSANTMNVADAGGLEAYNTANPNNTLTSGDIYTKGGVPNVGKATSKLNSYGIQAGQERSYVQQTQSGMGTDNFTTTRGSTSTFDNFFSKGATTANAAGGALANIGMQASPMGVVSQQQTFWGGNVKSPQSYANVRGTNLQMGGTSSIMSAQSTPWTSSAGKSYSGFQSVNQSQNATWNAQAYGNASNRGVNTRNLAFSGATNRKAAGGRISSSKVPALLTGGEYVINKDAVKKHGLSFMNSVNSQSLNKGGKVKGASMGASPLEDQSTILQQILETLLEQGAQEEARAEQIQNLTEKSESTVNNNTTQEIKTKGESQIKVLTSILEAIKEQNTELPAQISNTLQNSNIINNSTSNSSTNSSQSSNSSNSTINSTSNSSTSNSFVDNTTIQNNLLGEILETLKFPSAGPAPATSTRAGGAASGSNVNITVNVDSKGGEMGGGAEMTNSSSSGVNSVTKDRAAALASQIKSAVIEIITEQQRLGGILRKKP